MAVRAWWHLANHLLGTARAIRAPQGIHQAGRRSPLRGVPMTPMDLANLQRVLEAMQTELEDLLRNRAVRAVDPECGYA